MNRHIRASLIAVAALALAGSPVAAQSALQGSPPAEVRSNGVQPTEVLATEAAARLGISRAEAPAEAKAAAAQAEGQTMRWIVIVAVGVLLAAIILAVAD